MSATMRHHDYVVDMSAINDQPLVPCGRVRVVDRHGATFDVELRDGELEVRLVEPERLRRGEAIFRSMVVVPRSSNVVVVRTAAV